MKQMHSYLAYIVLILVVIAVINAFIGWVQKKEFTKKDRLLGLFALIAVHTQLLFGLGWYFMSPWYKSMKSNGMSETMKNSFLRLLAVEHPIMMILGVVFITIGWSKHKKKTTSNAKFKTFVIFYGITLLLFLSRIPWSQWF